MRIVLITLLTFMSSVAASAADIEASSTIDSVTVYPDGATVTRVLKLNLPAGENVVLARDFPLGLDPASLRVEGEGGARIQIGSIDARPPAPQPIQSTPEREKKIQALEDERAVARRQDDRGPRAQEFCAPLRHRCTARPWRGKQRAAARRVA